MWFVIVNNATLDIVHSYEADQVQQWGGEWGRPTMFTHVQVPDGLTWDTVMAVKDTQDNITLVEDPTKIQTKLQAKIDANKAYRDICLQKTDFTMLPDTGLTNIDDWKQYRSTLRTLIMTPPVSWPTEPSSPWGPFLPTPPVFYEQ